MTKVYCKHGVTDPDYECRECDETEGMAFIELRDGYVVDVSGLPASWGYRLIYHDNQRRE